MAIEKQENDVEFEAIDNDELTLKLKSLSNFSFYFGIISLLLFSWYFQLMLWGVIEVTTFAFVVYVILVSAIPLGGLVCGIISKRLKKGLLGLIINALIIASYITGAIAFLIINTIN